jgi:hypothetical protein
MKPKSSYKHMVATALLARYGNIVQRQGIDPIHGIVSLHLCSNAFTNVIHVYVLLLWHCGV